MPNVMEAGYQKLPGGDYVYYKDITARQTKVDKQTTIDSFYGTSNTPAATAAKVITVADTGDNFSLRPGVLVTVKFDHVNTANNPTFNVNGTGAKEIVDGHANMTKVTYTSGWVFSGNLVNDFIYDGTYWVWINRDNNTTYSSKTAASGGTATSLCTTGEKYTWNNKQNALTFDNVPTQNSNNPVKSGGIFSTIGDLTQTGLTGDSVAAQLDTAREQIATIHPNANTLSAPVFESHTAIDDVMKFYETGNDDYKAIRIYDKNNVNRYSLIFTGGHLKFTSKDASGTTIVDTTIV